MYVPEKLLVDMSNILIGSHSLDEGQKNIKRYSFLLYGIAHKTALFHTKASSKKTHKATDASEVYINDFHWTLQNAEWKEPKKLTCKNLSETWSFTRCLLFFSPDRPPRGSSYRPYILCVYCKVHLLSTRWCKNGLDITKSQTPLTLPPTLIKYPAPFFKVNFMTW